MKESLFALLDLHCLQMGLEWGAQNNCSDTMVRTQYQRLSQRVSVLQKMDDIDYLFFSPFFGRFYFIAFYLKAHLPQILSWSLSEGPEVMNGQRDPHICRDNVVLWSTKQIFSKCLVDYAHSSSFADTDLGVPNLSCSCHGLCICRKNPTSVFRTAF